MAGLTAAAFLGFRAYRPDTLTVRLLDQKVVGQKEIATFEFESNRGTRMNVYDVGIYYTLESGYPAIELLPPAWVTNSPVGFVKGRVSFALEAPQVRYAWGLRVLAASERAPTFKERWQMLTRSISTHSLVPFRRSFHSGALQVHSRPVTNLVAAVNPTKPPPRQYMRSGWRKM